MHPTNTTSTDFNCHAHKDVHLSTLVAMENPLAVLKEVKTIILAMDAGFDTKPVEAAFHDIVELFSGRCPGYKKCNTRYHDLKHTTDTLLAMARLIHGAHANGNELEGRDITLGLISALMHDVGYIQNRSEKKGTGAQYAPVHIPRGIKFLRTYLKKSGYSTYDYRKCRSALLCTDLMTPISSIRFETRSSNRMGIMLAAADLLGQTADRCYIEKLRFLYQEFREANFRGYRSERELLQDSLDFNKNMQNRLAHDLDGVDRYLARHFKTRWGIDRNLYHESIKKNIRYLMHILKKDTEQYTFLLRRMETSSAPFG